MDERDPLPEATNDAPAVPEMPDLVLGPPFAMTSGCDLLDAKGRPGEQGYTPGCFATVKCECGQRFKVNLLADGFKKCPNCNVEYTTVLLVAEADDSEILADALESVFVANGLARPREPNPDDPDAGDDEGDELDGDDDDEPDDGDDDDSDPPGGKIVNTGG